MRNFALCNMTPEEYIQLKAFARQDGALLSVLWIGSFVCYLFGLSSPTLGMVAGMLAIMSPFFAANRLRHFRDEAREGFISFARGYAYMVMSFFYAGLLLAVVIFVYFEFIDKGYLMGMFTQMMNSEEGKKAIELYGMREQMEQGLAELTSMRPIDFALNMLTVNITTGFLLGAPIAALMQRKMVNAGE